MSGLRKRVVDLIPGDWIWFAGETHKISRVVPMKEAVRVTWIEDAHETSETLCADVEWPVATEDEALALEAGERPSFVQRCIDIYVAAKGGKEPTCDNVAPLVREFYAMPSNGAGGSLHIVLDDGNVEDSHVDFCIQFAIEREDPFGKWLARVLRLMSTTQRKKLGELKWAEVAQVGPHVTVTIDGLSNEGGTNGKTG